MADRHQVQCVKKSDRANPHERIPHTSRRTFLQTYAALAGSLLLPRSLFARTPDRSFWFIHADSCTPWPVADPVAWSLEHAHEPVLERASEGLLKLTPDDGDRIIRLVVRRCRLNRLEVRPDQVVIYHWGQHRADLRPFFKKHGLARPQVEVVQRERKQEVVTKLHGDDFLFGDRLAADFPLRQYQSKWASRFDQEADDWTPAPGTWSGFAWEGVEDGRIPWAALKSAWRRTTALPCLNCDTPTILVNFGNPWTGMFNRSPRFVYVCGTCQRSFRDDAVTDVAGLVESNLDPAVWPGYDMVWDKRVKGEAT